MSSVWCSNPVSSTKCTLRERQLVFASHLQRFLFDKYPWELTICDMIDRRTMGPSLAGYRLRAYTHPPAGCSPDSDWYTDYDEVCILYLRCFNSFEYKEGIVCSHDSFAILGRTRCSRWRVIMRLSRGLYRRLRLRRHEDVGFYFLNGNCRSFSIGLNLYNVYRISRAYSRKVSWGA